MHFHLFAEHYKSEVPVELTVKQNYLSLSGEGFHVTDAEGKIVFKMDGHALSIRDKCTLEDHHGHEVMVARKKLRSMHERWEVCKGGHFDDDKILFHVKKSSMAQIKTHLYVYLHGNDNDDVPDFEVKGNFFERQAQIFHKDQLIAQVKRKVLAMCYWTNIHLQWRSNLMLTKRSLPPLSLSWIAFTRTRLPPK